MFSLSPIVAAGLLGLAALLASHLPRPPALTRALQWTAAVAPLGWYLLGVTLGPGVGILDRATLELAAPVIACAVGWVAAQATAELPSRDPAPKEWSAARALEAAGALLIPAALLVAAARWLIVPSLQQWRVVGPVVATLSAALALAGTGNPRRITAGSFALAAAALVVLLVPHITPADLKRGALSLGLAIGGAALCAVIAARLARRAPILPGTIAALFLAAGIGSVTGLAPLVVCGLMGFALARWSVPHARLALDLRIHEPAVAALLWTTAGAAIGGPLIPVAAATLLVTAWSLGRRAIGGTTPVDSTLGIAIATGVMVTAGPALGEWERAVPTVAALGLLLLRVIPITNASERLTSDTRRVEVSA